MSNRKVIFILCLFLLVLTSFRMVWISSSSAPTQIEAQQGVLDLRDWDFDENETLALDGEWEFYPNVLLTANEFDANEKKYVVKPEKWNENSSAYGTYRLRIIVAEGQIKPLYQILLPYQPYVAKVIVNHEVVIDNEARNDNGTNYNHGFVSRVASFSANAGNEIEILIQQPGYAITKASGIAKSIQFGNGSVLKRQYITSVAMQILVATITLFYFVHGCVIFLWRRHHIEFLYFGMAAFCATFATVMDDDKLLLAWIPIDYIWYLKIIYVVYIGVSVFMLLFIQNFFSEQKNNKVIRLFHIMYLLFTVILLLSPLKYIPIVGKIIFIIIVLSFATIAILMWGNIVKGNRDNLFLLLAAAGATSSFLWVFYKAKSLTELPYYPLDILVAFLSISILLFKRFFFISDQNIQLTIQLKQEMKRKDDFLANTSHELRNPLHGIINIAQSALQNGTGQLDEKNIELVVTIGRHMSRTLDDLLDVTRLKEHRIQLQTESRHLQSAVAGVVDMLKYMLENKNIRLAVQIADDFPEVRADKNRLIQIMYNLLHNAVKFSNDGTIIISADVQDGMANIHVKDMGVGIDKEALSLIFEPYEQGDSGMTAIGSGLGLGLSICRQLVELHGGTLQATSIVGEGSQFTFTLPLADEHREAATAGAQSILKDEQKIDSQQVECPTDYSAISNRFYSSESACKPKILAVDDDPINLQVLSTVLSAEQYELKTVTSGKAALVCLDRQEWDLIITDVMMPHMSGYELTRTIRERYSISELPILLTTARSQPEDIYTGFQAGANDYVTKPVDALELNVRVHALTELKDSVNARLRMEAAWLQAQIQPHFLYNTLNTIISLSEIDTDRMAIVIEKFGYYLRKSFDSKNLDYVVPFEHERKLVEAYLYIEKERFGDRLQVVWEVKDVSELRIPPLSIQTIVENAVRHGVLQQITGGTIIIRVEPKDGYTHISILDNGVGMAEDKVKKILTVRPDKKRGIGLLNTDQRLKQLYGKGLHIESTLGEGTMVSFEVPNEQKGLST